MPVISLSSGRSVSMTSSTEAFRSLRGFSVTTSCPRLGPPSVVDAVPPIVETRPATSGFWLTIRATSSWYFTSMS